MDAEPSFTRATSLAPAAHPPLIRSAPHCPRLVGNLRPHHRLRTCLAAGWRKHEILDRTWEDIDVTGGVIRLTPARSKTVVSADPPHLTTPCRGPGATVGASRP